MSSDVELVCDGCGATAVVQSGILNSYGITACPNGWTHSGRGMAVIGAKDYCPSCSPLVRGTPGKESSPPPRPMRDQLLAVLILEDAH